MDRRLEAIVGICATRTTLCTIVGFRAAAKIAHSAEQYYRKMWCEWREVLGGDRVRAALLRAAAIDGVRLEDDDAHTISR